VKVLSEGIVAVGRITGAAGAPNNAVDVSITVEEVLKGEPRATLQVHQDRGVNSRYTVAEYSQMSRDRVPVLLIGKTVMPLDQRSLRVPAASAEILREPQKVLQYIREAFRTHPVSNVVASFNLPLPKQFENVDWSPFFDSRFGSSPPELVVPVDARLERWAVDS